VSVRQDGVGAHKKYGKRMQKRWQFVSRQEEKAAVGKWEGWGWLLH